MPRVHVSSYRDLGELESLRSQVESLELPPSDNPFAGDGAEVKAMLLELLDDLIMWQEEA